MNVDENEPNFIIDKKDLLMVINNIYDSLLDIVAEIEIQSDHIKHLKGILKKDLVMRASTPNSAESHISLKAIKMNRQEWLDYVDRNTSNNNSNENSNNDGSYKDDSVRAPSPEQKTETPKSILKIPSTRLDLPQTGDGPPLTKIISPRSRAPTPNNR